MTFLTDFADQAVILPIVLTVAMMLAAQRRWRVLLAWLSTIGAVLGTMLVLKVACYTCSWMAPSLGPNAADLRSPSGHVASAAVAYGGVVALWLNGSKSLNLWTSSLAAVFAAVTIGVTRVELEAHSVAEVGLAAIIGVIGARVFVGLAGQQMQAKPGGSTLLATAMVATLMHGRHLPAEAMIQTDGSALLRRILPACDPDLGGQNAYLTRLAGGRLR